MDKLVYLFSPLTGFFGVTSSQASRHCNEASVWIHLSQENLKKDDLRDLAENFSGRIVTKVKTSSPTMAYFEREWPVEKRAEEFRRPQELVVVSIPEIRRVAFEDEIERRRMQNARQSALTLQ